MYVCMYDQHCSILLAEFNMCLHEELVIRRKYHIYAVFERGVLMASIKTPLSNRPPSLINPPFQRGRKLIKISSPSFLNPLN